MSDYQALTFRWAAQQPGITAAVLFALGLLYAVQGFRLARVLMGISCGVAGYAIGWSLAGLLNLPPLACGLGLGAALAIASLCHFRSGLVLACVATFAGLAYYVGYQLGFRPPTVLVFLGGGGLVGMAVAWTSLRTLPVLLTALHGSALLIVGFVGISSAALPSLGATFRDWASSEALLVPMFLAMLSVTAFSYQANLRQGDIRTGVGRSWNSLRV